MSTYENFIRSMKFGTDSEKLDSLKHIKTHLSNTEEPSKKYAIIDDTIYGLYNLSKWSNQILFINTLSKNLDEDQKKYIFDKVINKNFWCSIEKNRQDKFYYLLETFNRSSLLEILNLLDIPVEIKIFFVRKMINEDTVLQDSLFDRVFAFMCECEDIGLVKILGEVLSGFKELIMVKKKEIAKVYRKNDLNPVKRKLFGILYKDI